MATKEEIAARKKELEKTFTNIEEEDKREDRIRELEGKLADLKRIIQNRIESWQEQRDAGYSYGESEVYSYKQVLNARIDELKALLKLLEER